MSLDFLRDNTNIVNGKGAVKREQPFDMTNWGSPKTSVSAFQPRKQAGVQSKQIVKVYANNEKQIVDLVTKALTRNPKLVHSIAKGLDKGLIALQHDFEKRGQVVNLKRAYEQSKKANNLLGRLLAFVAKGIITVGNQKINIPNKPKAKIQLLTAQEAESTAFKRIGRFSGTYMSRPAISRFRISAVNELSQVLGTGKIKAMSAISSICRVDDYYNNDLAKSTTYNVSGLSDEEIADVVESGAYTKDEVKAMLHPHRIKRVNQILQKRAML